MKLRLLLVLVIVTMIGCAIPSHSVIVSRDCQRLLSLAQTAEDTIIVRGVQVHRVKFPCGYYIDAFNTPLR